MLTSLCASLESAGTWRGLPVAVKTVVFEAWEGDDSSSSGAAATKARLPYMRAIMETAISASLGHLHVVRVIFARQRCLLGMAMPRPGPLLVFCWLSCSSAGGHVPPRHQARERPAHGEHAERAPSGEVPSGSTHASPVSSQSSQSRLHTSGAVQRLDMMSSRGGGRRFVPALPRCGCAGQALIAGSCSHD